ncbi:hypothetical protein S7711_04848 [Stachybotrys chartarum IBT 7711]|uniref:Meiotically up-regulated protein Msb1/Mug8 domain-containing protein n=1 Tax=Stachybotrys chartarum (strain CBS 109288 / IBT 7711) TaxID=1280523 RepID=A0A084AMJ3_STACB|nr:hypothetical protein S7711_04848 [Stachybotrys chartarum IBT 7711]KFA51069.1 hypothetical protein S40293_08222 [Stachybotrys chartarum IBT 40293]
MPGLFSRLKSRDARSKKKDAAYALANVQDSKPKWTDAYTRIEVEPEEVHELVHYCTEELKARALSHPFFLLPFRPTSDPSAVRSFVKHFFRHGQAMRGEVIGQELRLVEPMVIAGVIKWCWSRLRGGVVGWDAYELFKVGELDSNMARDSFKTFIPISVENGARQRIIFDYFDLMAAVAAHGKRNGFGGYKLSRLAAWWAFEQKDTLNGFEGGYKAWLKAADATAHLFFAYLRSISPEQPVTGIQMLPKSLDALLRETRYPPVKRPELTSRTNKVVMIVDHVSPTPFALLRRAKHFQYRDTDRALQEYSEFEDPIQALTEECRRVLKAISAANQSQVSNPKHSTGLQDASWSRFEDIGFASSLDEEDDEDDSILITRRPQQGLRTTPASGNGLARPTTPSWADFLSSGFVNEHPNRPNLLLPPDKILPPIETQPRQNSSQSHRPRLESDKNLEPGELASIAVLELDDAFWWVWMSSLAPEETLERKSAFGRCAVIETDIPSGRWLIMEEMVAGAAPDLQDGAYLAEKKGFFSWTKTLGRRRSTGKRPQDRPDKNRKDPNISKTSLGPDTHARVQAKAAQLRAKDVQERQLAAQGVQRRGRSDAELMAEKTNSVFTLQPALVGEASSAMSWVKKYDKATIKEAYMANSSAGRGMPMSPAPSEHTNTDMQGTNFGYEPSVPTPARKPVGSSTAAPLVAPVSPVSLASAPMPVSPTSDPAPAISPRIDAQQEAPWAPVANKPDPPATEEERVPAPLPKDEPLPEVDREGAMTPDVGEEEPDGKKQHKKLHKEQKEARGFRKMFGRKNRASKLPDNAAASVNNMLQSEARPSDDVHTQEAATSPPDASTQGPSKIEREVPEPMLTPTVAVTPAEEPAQLRDTSPGASAPDNLSRVNTRDADEAAHEFSRFDQGPLADQPAFIPNDDSDDDDAVPPPIQRNPSRRSAHSRPPPPKVEEKLSQSAGPGVQDRWAQIRKNAAERAASRQRDDTRTPFPPAKAGDIDDTSEEETIESRVARIKARVAELTGNMEGTAAPQPARVP